jgi:FKBP-type peptidyl-prolyl cis-trans isomerase 2
MGLWPKLEDALENKKVDEISVYFEPGEVFGKVDEDLNF